MSNEKLVMCDLDGTLIDNNYEVTDKRIYDAVATAQAAGWIIGLSSDSPYKALQNWRSEFGMNGPIIAEKGAVVELDSRLEFDRADAIAVVEARQKVCDFALRQGIRVWLGNPVDALRRGDRVGVPGATVMLMNSLSQCSLRYFIRRIDAAGKPYIDEELTDQVVRDCRVFYPAFDRLDEDFNPSFGLVIVARGGIDKRSGTTKLLAKLGIERCIMIGNSMGDYIGADVVDQYAVADASEEYKQQSVVVAGQPITAGVVEILKDLANASVAPDSKTT